MRLVARCRTAGRPLALLLGLLAAPWALADTDTFSRNGGTIQASVQLDFEVNIYKFVMLRVGAGDASATSVEFRVGLTPNLGFGNSQTYAGAVPGLTTRGSTTNPASASSAVTVEMFSNVIGTQLTCSLSTLAGATDFAPGGTTAAGVPGRNNILVAASGGLAHPGTDLGACTGATTAPVTLLSNLAGTFTYSTNFTPASLAPGTYGNVVTYTLTAP